MTIWKGGRGVKAPYQTTHIRIPVDIKPQVEAISQAYKEGQTIPIFTRSEVIEKAREILKQKKNARTSLENLLTAIYKDKIVL